MNRREGHRSRVLSALFSFLALLFCLNASGADAADLSPVFDYPGESFYYGILSDQAFLACYSQDADALVSEWIDQDTEIMMCDWFDRGKVYFAAPEGCSVSLMGGYLLVVRDTLFAGEGEEPAYCAAVYDQSGSCVSAMKKHCTVQWTRWS